MALNSLLHKLGLCWHQFDHMEIKNFKIEVRPATPFAPALHEDEPHYQCRNCGRWVRSSVSFTRIGIASPELKKNAARERKDQVPFAIMGRAPMLEVECNLIEQYKKMGFRVFQNGNLPRTGFQSGPWQIVGALSDAGCPRGCKRQPDDLQLSTVVVSLRDGEEADPDAEIIEVNLCGLCGHQWQDTTPPTIIVERRPDDCRAFVSNQPTLWGAGKSAYEAVGDLVVHHPEAFGLTAVVIQ